MGREHVHILTAIIASAAVLAGCGGSKSVGGEDNNTTPESQFEAVDLVDYRDFVERVAPPVFVVPATAPTDTTIWTDGDYPLLGKVFGAAEPMSLYANIDYLDFATTEIEDLLLQDSLGEVFVDSAAASESGGAAEISQLANGAAIPTEYQEVIGELRVDVEKLVKVTWSDTITKESHLGFTLTDTTQKVLTWSRFTTPGSNEVSTFLFYAAANRADSSILMRGLFYKDYGDGTSARWVYHIESVDSVSFTYRMSWYSDDFGGQSAIAAIVGGGDKMTEFVLRYRQYSPPTSQAADPYYLLDQTFGPNFAFGDTTIASSYNEYVNENLIFRYNAFPQSEIISPWAVTK